MKKPTEKQLVITYREKESNLIIIKSKWGYATISEHFGLLNAKFYIKHSVSTSRTKHYYTPIVCRFFVGYIKLYWTI